MKRVAVFVLALAFAPVAWAEEIPLERVKSAEGLPEETRSLLKGMAGFQLNAVEERLLAEKPGAGDAMIEICELVQEVEHLSVAFMALRMRTDLNSAQQNRVREMLEPLVGVMTGSRVAIVKQHGMYLLSKYPGEENEALLVRFLEERKHWRDPDYTDIAAMALGLTGTPKSINALRQYAARSKPPAGYINEGYDAAVKAEKLIMERAERKGRVEGAPAEPKLGEPRSAMALYDQLLGALVGRYGGEELDQIKETTVSHIRKISGHARELGDKLEELSEVVGVAESSVVKLQGKLSGSMHGLVESLDALPGAAFPMPSEALQSESGLAEIAKGLWSRIEQTSFDWSASEKEARQQIDDLTILHRWLCKETGYGNLLLSGACEQKICRGLVTGLMSQRLAAGEVKSKIDAILVARPDRMAIADFMVKAVPKSKMVERFADDLKTGKTSLLHASGVLLREEGSGHPLLLQPNPGEWLSVSDPIRVVQYSALGLNFLHWSSAIADFVVAGGDLSLEDADLVVDLQDRVPQYFKEKSQVTGERNYPKSVVEMIKPWRGKGG